MTIVLNDRRARYVASAAQTKFDVDFPIDSDADVAVYHKVELTGVITLLTLTTDYTVTLDGAAPNTADVDLVTGAAVDDIITIEGDTSVDRASDFTTGGDFFAGTVNNAEDRQYRIDQERKRDRDRTVVANPVSPDTFDPTLPDTVDEALKFLRLNAGETDLEFAEFTTIGTAVLSDATPAAPTAAGASGTSADISRADHAHPASLLADTTPQLGGVLDSNGQAINESEATAVASAATCDIWATDGNTVHVTGTDAITSFGTAPRVGAWRKVIFDDALTLTDGANLNLPGGANITTAADDFCFVYAETTTLFKCLYFPVAGTAVKLTPDFTSANQNVSADTRLDVSHGLGAVPSLIRVVMICTSANLNYAVDDAVEMASQSSASADTGVTIFATSSTVSLVQSAAIRLIDKSTFNAGNIDTSKWQWIVRAWL